MIFEKRVISFNGICSLHIYNTIREAPVSNTSIYLAIPTSLYLLHILDVNLTREEEKETKLVSSVDLIVPCIMILLLLFIQSFITLTPFIISTVSISTYLNSQNKSLWLMMRLSSFHNFHVGKIKSLERINQAFLSDRRLLMCSALVCVHIKFNSRKS